MQREARISPHFGAEKLDNPSVDDVIDVFEDRVVHWLLEPAGSVLLQSQFGDPASTCLALTYFESIRVYSTGTKSAGQSKAFFVAGFLDVFRGTGIDQELLGRVAEILYADARCGFFHDGLFRQRIFFQRKPGAAIEITVPMAEGRPDPSGEIQSILIDAREFLSWRPQPVAATARLNTSEGFIQSSVCRGRELSWRATAARSAREYRLRSAPFGKYWRRSPFVFSLLPRCHGLCGSQKYTSILVSMVRYCQILWIGSRDQAARSPLLSTRTPSRYLTP